MISGANINDRIVFLSEPAPVKMGTEWFDIVDADHFWIRNRFRVFQKITAPLSKKAKYAEIGCGTGLFQCQIDRESGISIDGFDLDLEALKKNTSRAPLFVYNIFDKRPELKSTYDGLFLFDVLEHLDEDKAFLESCLYHIKPGGRIFINVPSREELRSKYDMLVGHVRRYSLPDLVSLAESCGLTVQKKTYWGMPLYPVLVLRKHLMKKTPNHRVLQSGMKPPGQLSNKVLALLSLLEPIPQTILGTSAMLIAQKPTNG
jgi:SAM-dependent methyltransferase